MKIIKSKYLAVFMIVVLQMAFLSNALASNNQELITANEVQQGYIELYKKYDIDVEVKELENLNPITKTEFKKHIEEIEDELDKVDLSIREIDITENIDTIQPNGTMTIPFKKSGSLYVPGLLQGVAAGANIEFSCSGEFDAQRDIYIWYSPNATYVSFASNFDGISYSINKWSKTNGGHTLKFELKGIASFSYTVPVTNVKITSERPFETVRTY